MGKQHARPDQAVVRARARICKLLAYTTREFLQVEPIEYKFCLTNIARMSHGFQSSSYSFSYDTSANFTMVSNIPRKAAYKPRLLCIKPPNNLYMRDRSSKINP